MIKFIEPIFPPLDECTDSFRQIYSNGHFTNEGPFVQQLEMLLKRYIDTDRDIIMVNSATSGLLMAIKTFGLEGKEILVPSFTFPATIGTIKWAMAKYRYIDINIDTYCIDESLIEDELKENDNIEAIMAVNCFGNVCNIKKIEKMVRDYDIKIIYDSAPALGSEIYDKKVGNFGDIEVFSLHATKILPTGEGGFLSVKDRDTSQKLRKMKNFGYDKQKTIVTDGLNFKMPEFSAIFGIVGLKYLDTYISNRRKYVKMYQDKLEDIKYIKFQDTDHCKSSYQGITVRVDSIHRDKLFSHLINSGIECKKYFDMPLHKTSVYMSRKEFLPNTEKLSSQILSLPLYSIMDETLIDCVTDKIRDYMTHKTRQ